VHQVLTFTREHAQAESSFNNCFGTSYLGTLEHLMKYGRTYLNETEYRQCLQKSWAKYYSFLGGKVFHKKEKAFWGYQIRALGRIGHSISKAQVTKYALAEVFDLLLNPLNTSKKIAKRLRKVSLL